MNTISTVADIKESGLLSRLRSRLLEQKHGDGVLVDVGDDAAVVRLPPGDTVLTCDALVENVHFRHAWSSPADIGWKTLACSLSDLAAMGATPCYALVSLALPGTLPVQTFDEFYEGLLECAGVFRTRIVGGDIVSGDQLMISLTAVGMTPADGAFRLDGAQPGDDIVVSGDLGNAELGVCLLTRSIDPCPRGMVCVAAHRRPMPRLDLVEELRRLGPTAVTDTSDGLDRDLRKICHAGGVGAEVEIERIPTHRAAYEVAMQLDLDLQVLAATAGEDFQLLFTLPTGTKPPPRCRKVGRITQETDIRFTRNGEPFTLDGTGYDHFSH